MYRDYTHKTKLGGTHEDSTEGLNRVQKQNFIPKK